jgi:hypothetical protein
MTAPFTAQAVQTMRVRVAGAAAVHACSGLDVEPAASQQ